MKSSYESLAALRVELLDYTASFITSETAIASERLEKIENGDDPPTIGEAIKLASVYGIDPRLLARRPIRLAPGDGISVLALSSEFRRISPTTRKAIVAAANAARDLGDLEEALGLHSRYDRFAVEHRPPVQPRRDRPPYQQGRDIARALRRQLGHRGPIASLRTFIAERFPSITILDAHLGRDADLGGVSFADRRRGVTIILNIDGRNENPLVRRFSLAHELCHLLIDWSRMQPLAVISEVRDDAKLEIEQRANGFASRFICPEEAVLALRKHSPRDALAAIIGRWGLHFNAACLYLHRAGGFALADLERAPRTFDESIWTEAEAIPEYREFPISEVPVERRTLVARHASRLYLDGRIDADQLTGYLGLNRIDMRVLSQVLAHCGGMPGEIEARNAHENALHPLRGKALRISEDFDDPLPEWELMGE